MNNEKIGKFIAKLRKAKGLTQQELGDLVGVGGKSVSKWERGINMPDVSIINEVSKILGITSDELLKGEFDRNSNNEEYKKKKNQRRTLILLSILIVLTIAITTLLMFHFKNDTHKYWLTSADKNFSVDGSIEYDKKGYTMNINNMYCRLEECKNYKITNTQYMLSINDIIIYKNQTIESNESITINEYLDNKRIYLDEIYKNSIFIYNDLKSNKIKMTIILEGNYINGESFDYRYNLKIDDKKE